MPAPYYVQCVLASDGVAVAPCGTVNGEALVPSLVSTEPPALDYSQLGPLFSWAVSCVLIAFVVGLVVGSILRVLRGV